MTISSVIPQGVDPREPGARIIESSGNVFVDLGFDPAEAQVLKRRAEVMIRTAEQLKVRGWTQAEGAQQLDISQPRVSRLIKGNVEDVSLDRLLTLATRAGLGPELRLTVQSFG